MPLFETYPVGLQDFMQVKNQDLFRTIFAFVYAVQSDVLYNHSAVFPFSYLNKGKMKLYINKDVCIDTTQQGKTSKTKIIPVVKQFEYTLEHKPIYFIHCPIASIEDILATVDQLDVLSSVPVLISDVTEAYASWFLANTDGWEKVKTSDDVIQDACAMASLKGRNYSSLRNTLKHVREDLKPVIFPLNRSTYKDAISVFYAWKDKQGKKYFRVTIGRDVRLIQEYFDKIDEQRFFSYVYYVNGKPEAVSFGCAAEKPQWGVDITVKANTNCKGLADFAFVHLLTEMNKHGIVYVNDSGGTGKVLLNKKKFRPIKTIPCYDLRRKI